MSSISKMLFTIADKVFYDSLDRYAVKKHDFFDYVQQLLPGDWKLDRSSMWFNVTPPNSKLPSQGWKIHLSTTPSQAKEMLRRTVPLLVKRKLAFKFALDTLVLSIITGKGWSIGGAGKFITVYFDSEQQFVSVAEELHQATADLEGPFIVSDRQYRGSRVIYYRYGGLSPVEVLTAKGEKILVISQPDGSSIPDRRLSHFVLPDWVRDPFPGPHPPSPGEPPVSLKDGRYAVQSTLAVSSCGGVYLATDTANQAQVIIKQARPLLNFTPNGDHAMQLLEREYRLLKKVEDTGLAPRPLDFFQEGEQSYLVEEHIPNAMPLRFYSGGRTIVLLTEPTREKVEAFWREYKRIFLRVARMLAKLHERGIMFMDFSHNNVLVGSDGETLKLIDFEAAFDTAVDRPSYLLTPGFASLSDLNLPASVAHDYFSFGAAMLSYILPVNGMIVIDPTAPARFLESIAADYSLPSGLDQLVFRLMHSDARLRPSLSETADLLEKMEVTAAPQYGAMEDMRQACRETVDGVVEHILASATYERKDRLFPSDPKVFLTNPLNIAFGACGVAWALKKMTGGVPSRAIEWMLRQPIDTKQYPPGLYFGTAGIAWVFKELGLQEKAEELMRLTWNHPGLAESPDMFYGLAGWGMAQLRFFLDTGNEKYLQQAIRAAEMLESTAQEENGHCHWSPTGSPVALGFAHGASGISIFLLYLYLATGDSRFLDLGKRALEFDIAATVPNLDGNLSLQVRRLPGAPGAPYLRYGSSGLGMAMVRYYRALGDPRYLNILNDLLPDACRKYGISPGRFIGLSGIGEFLLPLAELEPFHAKCSEALQRLITGIMLFRVKTPGGMAFPGYELYRLSCDFATGSAGIALFLHDYLTGSNSSFLLDDLLLEDSTVKKPSSYSKQAQSLAPKG